MPGARQYRPAPPLVDLRRSGGAERHRGRRNSKGKPVVCCAASIALATLETVHYLRSGGLPFNRFLVRVDLADALWDARQVLDPLPGGWDAVPAGVVARTAGDAWIKSGSSAVLLVPSVIVPDEYNVLVNPGHRDAATIIATTVKRWIFDPRFFG